MLLTIVITSHNNEKTLRDALKSIIDSDQKLQIIVVDDGSSDCSRDIISKTISEYPKAYIRTIFQENLGSAKARNIGLEQTNTDWVSFLDGDDVLISENIVKVCSLLSVTDFSINAIRLGYLDKSDNGIVLQNSQVKDNHEYLTLFKQLGFWRYIYKTEYLKSKRIFFFPTFQEAKGLFILDDYFFLLYFLSFKPNLLLFDIEYYVYHSRFVTNSRLEIYQKQLLRQGAGFKILRDLIEKNSQVDKDFVCDIIRIRIERSLYDLRYSLPLITLLDWCWFAIRFEFERPRIHLRNIIVVFFWFLRGFCWLISSKYHKFFIKRYTN